MMMGTMHRYFENVEDQVLLQSPLICRNFAKGRADPCYKPVKVWELLRNILEEFLESYSEMHASMNLVIFEDAMQYVCRISHILEAPTGSLNHSEERRWDPGAEGRSWQFVHEDWCQEHTHSILLTDAQVPDEHFLVLINDLLASDRSVFLCHRCHAESASSEVPSRSELHRH
ncbi:hypothetical protein AV530_014440 [Patagioenas fasciata monilis]|uniref:Uncharacterized protein n=1 Tax=Patagioenas fasciata monilis TaxID=372326 RepID=A0A1V4KBS4_PATFA|nr:hypothetical protein AV530_014440 [Patagioenas fasciata monilis]